MRITDKLGGAPRFRRVACGLVAGAALLTAAPLGAFACTQVWVPGQFTATGDRYVGRAEDYAPRHVKIFGIEQPQANTHYTSDETAFDWTSPKTSYRYTYVRDHPSDWSDRHDAYSEAGINEHGVSCSATLTTDMNDEIKAVDPLTDGIGEYSYAGVILGESKTAREGVELLGTLIDDQGTSGNDQITISDPNETWLFCALSGHQWVAYKMPEDQASLNPNMGNLRFKVDLDDAQTCLHSAGLLSTPENAGLLKRFADGTPDIASTYGEPDAKQSPGTNTRYVQGRHYFEAPVPQGAYTVTPNKGVTRLVEPTQFFTPGRSGWTTNELLRFLAARGEGTDVDANQNPEFYSIGNKRTVESHLFQIRGGLTPDIATVQWEALSRTEFSVYVPLYSALITEVSPYFCDLDCDASHQGAQQNDDAVAAAMQEEPANSLPFVLMDINTLAYNHRAAMGAGTRAYLDALQKQIIAQQDIVDAAMKAAPAGPARTELANKAQMAVVEQTYLKCDRLLDEMRAYLNAGDLTQPFAASDMNASGTDLATPVSYADAIVAPSITQQPVDATYTQGAAATDLTVVAATASGMGDLSYEWFAKSGATETTTGIKTANFPVDTSKAGDMVFFCRVTNASGLSVDSNAVTISVKAVARPIDPNPQSPATKPGKTPGKTTGSLPQTGDPLSAIALAGMTLTGACTATCASRARRRNRRNRVQ